MNRIYRLVWNRRHNAMMAVAETSRGCGKSGGRATTIAAAVTAALAALAAGEAVAQACPAAVSSVITVSSAVTSGCSLGTGESLVVTPAGSIEDSQAVEVNGVVAGSVSNAGFIHGTADTGIEIFNNGVLGSLTNTGTIQGLSYGIILSGGSITGGLTNSGTIQGASTGLQITSGSSIAGGIHNSGTINATGGFGVSMVSSTISGGISNSGLISGHSVGLTIRTSSVITGGISNSGTIHGSQTGLRITSGSHISGGIHNSGLISATTDAAIYISNSLIDGGITNTGTISAGSSYTQIGILLSGATVNGAIVNQGLIEAFGTESAFGIAIEASTLTGDITNTGTIRASGTSDTPAGILLSHSTMTGSIVNSGTITAETGGYGIHLKSNATMTGGITNSGTIQGDKGGIAVDSSVMGGGITNSGLIQGGTAIRIDHSSIGGTITNSGTISATNGGTAISMLGSSTLTGGVVNSGLITSTGYGLYMGGEIGQIVNSATGRIVALNTAIRLFSASVSGGISNSGTISGSNGIVVASGSTVSGGISNSGTISGGTAAIYVDQSTVSGGITNSGTLTAGRWGIELQGAAVVSGGDVVNSGLIQADTNAAINIVQTSTIAGSITNTGTLHGATGIWMGPSSVVTGRIQNTGTIVGTRTGIAVYSGSTVLGGITNSGSISGGNGIVVSSGSIVSGGITNSGMISGAAEGIKVRSGSEVDGDVVNNAGGTITGQTALYVQINSAVSGSITNSGNILGSNVGIYLTGSTVHGIVNQSGGTIAGTGGSGITISSTSTVSGGIINQAGGVITGGSVGIAINGSSVLNGGITNSGTISGGDFSIFDSTGSLTHIHISGTTASLQGDVKATAADVVVKSGATFANTNAFDVNSFTVESGALFNFGAGPRTSGGLGWGLSNDGVKVSNGFTNSGTVAVAAGVTAPITGTYAQSAGGVYRMGLTDTTSNYGKLAVSGNATLANGSTVDVVISGSPTITNGTTVQGVITSGGTLTATPAQITVTDNNLFYDFTASTARSANELDLVIATDSTVFTDAAAASGNPSLRGVAGALQTMLNTGVPTAFQPVFAVLGTMTQDQLNVAMAQMLPPLVGAAPQAGINALHSMNKIIQSRIESNQGLSSGEAGADKYMWMRVFGNAGDQDNHDGVTGFESKTAGLVIGADAPVTDRIRAGGAFTYAKSDIDSNSSSAPSSVNVDTYELVGYGSYNLDPYTDINFQLDIGQNKADSKRRIAFMGTKAKADFDSLAWHASVGIGRLFPLSERTNVTPSLRLDYTHMRTEDYTESGAGPLNLKVDADTYEEFLLSADVKGTHQLDDKLKLVGNVSLGYDFASDKTQVASTFTGGGPAFSTTGLDVSPWLYRAGLGLIHDDKKGLEYSVRYDVEGRSSGYFNQTLAARLRWAF